METTGSHVAVYYVKKVHPFFPSSLGAGSGQDSAWVRADANSHTARRPSLCFPDPPTQLSPQSPVASRTNKGGFPDVQFENFFLLKNCDTYSELHKDKGQSLSEGLFRFCTLGVLPASLLYNKDFFFK